jgi:hypothetical protein
MPLIVICGPPCSGKTTRATEIKNYLEQYKKPIFLINEEYLSLKKEESYKGISFNNSPRLQFRENNSFLTKIARWKKPQLGKHRDLWFSELHKRIPIRTVLFGQDCQNKPLCGKKRQILGLVQHEFEGLSGILAEKCQ